MLSVISLRTPDENLIRSLSFVPSTRGLRPAVGAYVRKTGRPKKEWIPSVLTMACRIFGEPDVVRHEAADARSWKLKISKERFI